MAWATRPRVRDDVRAGAARDDATAGVKRGLLRAARRVLGRVGLRLLVVNLLVVLVPVAGLEFARLYERQLLGALERDMRNQAVLIRRLLEVDRENAIAVGTSAQQEVLRRAAADTRMRVRVLARGGNILLDSHRDGAPEGPEPLVPSLIPGSSVLAPGSLTSGRYRAEAGDFSAQWSDAHDETWPSLAERVEVRRALVGERASFTRVRDRSPEVLLFVAEPVFEERRVVAVVYVVRSTQPVLLDLYRIRRGLISVLSIAIVFTVLISLALGWTISRPLSRLSRAARRITRGDRDVPVPIVGSGEIRELSESFASMTLELDGRLRYISDFAADVAHEFKSPLTSIRGAAELLGEGAAEDPDARQRFLRNIELDVLRLDRLVSRLLELSRIEASQDGKVEVDLVPLVHDVARRASTPEVTVRVAREGEPASSSSSRPRRARGNRPWPAGCSVSWRIWSFRFRTRHDRPEMAKWTESTIISSVRSSSSACGPSRRFWSTPRCSATPTARATRIRRKSSASDGTCCWTSTSRGHGRSGEHRSTPCRS